MTFRCGRTTTLLFFFFYIFFLGKGKQANANRSDSNDHRFKKLNENNKKIIVIIIIINTRPSVAKWHELWSQQQLVLASALRQIVNALHNLKIINSHLPKSSPPISNINDITFYTYMYIHIIYIRTRTPKFKL